ncbi:MAG: DUF11 domain-containing protein [Actinobacteria bacterium]|nr:MAG: DUF11 domain-containing protein [Actinomycetota bacterium]
MNESLRTRSFAASVYTLPARIITVLIVTAVMIAVSGLAAIALPATQFELDGNAVSNGHDDWQNVLAGTGGDFNHSFMTDENNDTTYFTGGGSKDGHDVSDWKYNALGAQDKDEITNAYSAAYINAGHLDLYFGADRYANSGDSTAGFWFFQNKISLDGSGGFSGVHSVGDLLIVSDFSNGGAISSIKAYKWNGSGLTAFSATGGDCSTHLADPLCAIVNQTEVTAPWAYTPKSGTAGKFPAIGSFLEGGIDLNDSNVFGANVPCFASYLVETRASNSTDSTLSDFALGSVNTCGKVTGTKYNDLNINGSRNNGEPGLENWTISLVGSGATVTTKTDANGNYEFDDVEPGTYTVCETMQNTWSQSQPSSGADCSAHGGGKGYSITIGLGDTVVRDFGNYQSPDLAIDKTADAASVSAGSDIGFKIKVTNNGPGPANSVSLTDPLPTKTGISWTVADDGGATCNIASNTLTCTKSVLASGASFTVHVTSHTTKDSCGTYDNTATVSASHNDGSPQDSASTEVLCASIAIDKTADQGTVSAGTDIGFKIKVTNIGAGAATGVSMTDTLPTNAGLSWTVADDGGATCGISSGVLTCTMASLASGVSFTVHITSPTTKATCGTVDNTASVTTTNDGHGEDSASISVLCPSIDVAKVADQGTVSAGTGIGFKITVTNTGQGNATNVTMTDTLPTNAGLSWTVADDGGATCGISQGVLTCTMASLAAGAHFTVHITSPTDKTTCGTVNNTASASAENDGSDQASASVTVLCPAIDVAKVADADPVNANDPVGFKITVTNTGQGDATDVTMTDTLPTNAGLSWTVADDGGATCGISAGVLTCTMASLASGAHFTVHITSPTTKATCGTINNTASASAENDGSDEASASIHVLCPDVTITKIADAGTVKGGDVVGFTITVSNADTQTTGTAYNVVVTDPLPSGLTWHIDPTVQGCSITNGSLTCNVGNLGPGDHFSVHIVSDPTTAADCGTTVTNTGYVTLDNGDGGNATDHVDVTCPDLGIGIAKDGPQYAHVGDTVQYTMTVTNGTDEPLSNIVVTDPKCNSAPVYQSGDTNNDQILQSGEAWVYTCDHVVLSTDTDPLLNTAHVDGQDKLGRHTSNEASHSVDILHPSISIVKTANPISGGPGDPVTYTYVVKNTSSDTTLYNVTVTDDKLGFIGTIAVLAPGQSVTLHKSTTLPTTAGALTNVGTATGADRLGKKVSAHDDAVVTVVLAIRLPRTGSDTGLPLETGFALLGIGFVFIGIARKRHAVEDEIEASDS